MKKLIVILVSMFVLVACKTPVVGMQQHASFTYETVMQGQVVIGGVVSNVDELTDLDRLRYSDIQSRAFIDEHQGIKIVRVGQLLQAMGAEPYHKWLDRFMVTGVITNSDADIVHQLFPHARYLILSRIESHNISEKHSETETDVADSEEDREKGEFEFVRVDVSLTTSRQMGVTMMVYDMDQQLLVWSGYISKTESDSNSSSRTFDKHKRWSEELVAAFIDGLIQPDSNSYPAAPPEAEVLEAIFEGFAENMPEPTK